MFENLDENQKALLSRGLNSELNEILKLYKMSNIDSMKEVFKHQYITVYNMWVAVYGDNSFYLTAEEMFEEAVGQ